MTSQKDNSESDPWEGFLETVKPIVHDRFFTPPKKSIRRIREISSRLPKYMPDHESYGSLRLYNARELKNVMIERAIDLHGYHFEGAEKALGHFLKSSWSRGLRWVLVITGKGKHQEGFLKENLRTLVPQWLENQWKALVVGYGTAPANEGGEGALYVHLRRAKRSRSDVLNHMINYK